MSAGGVRASIARGPVWRNNRGLPFHAERPAPQAVRPDGLHRNQFAYATRLGGACSIRMENAGNQRMTVKSASAIHCAALIKEVVVMCG